MTTDEPVTPEDFINENTDYDLLTHIVTTPEARIRAYLALRKGARGLDPDVVAEWGTGDDPPDNIVPLLISDIEAILPITPEAGKAPATPTGRLLAESPNTAVWKHGGWPAVAVAIEAEASAAPTERERALEAALPRQPWVRPATDDVFVCYRCHARRVLGRPDHLGHAPACAWLVARRLLEAPIGEAEAAAAAHDPATPSGRLLAQALAPSERCAAGCGCRLWTDDADRHDCGCDGPCCWLSWDDYMVDVLTRPDYYRELRAARGEPIAQPDAPEASR